MSRGKPSRMTNTSGKEQGGEEDRFQMIKTPLKKVNVLFDRIRTHRKIMFHFHRSMKINHRISLVVNEVRSCKETIVCLLTWSPGE